MLWLYNGVEYLGKVLVACEFSGIVRDAFIKLGHDAWSCDIVPSEADNEKHYCCNVLEVLANEKWDLMIAHPPCTYICRNRSRLNRIEYDNPHDRDEVIEHISEAYEFFLDLLNADVPRICVENPVPSRALKNMKKYTQIIQPYHYGHDYSKKTCLWLKNLPKLQPTKIVELTYIVTKNGHRYTKGWYKMPRTTKDRSRTFTGIAKAMAEQWGVLLG